MNLSLFFTFLKKNANKTLLLPRQTLLQRLQLVARENTLHLLENVTIYHHSQSFFIPLFLMEQSRGIFLFEYKNWSYKDLKNATIQKATQQDSSKNTLAFEKAHQFIRLKLDNVDFSDIPIFNFLMMENLSFQEYESLDDTIKRLLPKERIIFNNFSSHDILGSIIKTEISQNKLFNPSIVIGTIFTQYAILDNSNSFILASQEQMKFIDYILPSIYTLKGVSRSGKTSVILLKAIVEKLQDSSLNIVIIKPISLDCDLLQKKLFDILTYAKIDTTLISIEIMTPKDFVNKYLSKINLPLLINNFFINPLLTKKYLNAVDLIICDDYEMYPSEFLTYLQKIDNQTKLLIVENAKENDNELAFTRNFELK